MAKDTTERGTKTGFYGGNHYGRIREECTDVGGASSRCGLGMV